jgi:hypothetical protein
LNLKYLDGKPIFSERGCTHSIDEISEAHSNNIMSESLKSTGCICQLDGYDEQTNTIGDRRYCISPMVLIVAIDQMEEDFFNHS